MKNSIVLLLLSVLCINAAADAQSKEYSYAVVVSESTYSQPQWQAVVKALKVKHDAAIVKYSGDVNKALAALTGIFPDYTCFVCTPEESGRDFVAAVHVLTRKLDSDPYGDTIWGIITGYEPADALRIAKYDIPLTVKRALNPTVGAQLNCYDEGIMFSELSANTMWQKSKGSGQLRHWCPTDTSRIIADALMQYQPDIFITSGHATERNWMIGYSYPNGFFLCDNGQWYARDTKNNRFDINSPNPKVFIGVGNCLIGHIPDRNCMTLAMTHSGGFYQFIGYTVPTGYGYGGWGVKDYFSELQAGRFSLAQANFANNQALIFELEKRSQNTPGPANGGLRGDRDVVVMYGDPAWQAQMPKRTLPWSQQLTETDGVYTFTITANQRGDWDNRPVIHLFDHRLKDIKLIQGSELNPVITDNFILVPLNKGLLPMKGNQGEDIPITGDYQKGDVFTVVFKADKY